MRKGIITVLLLLLCHLNYAGEYIYDYSPLCREAYRSYMSMDFEQANSLIKREIRNNPYNLIATYLADYEDCLVILFNGSKKDYEQRLSHLDQRQDILSRGSDNSPWYRLCKAGVYIRWAMVSIRMGENLRAANCFRKSYVLLKDNRRLFPHFEYNDVFWGLEETIVGTIPDEYKWIASIFGFKGNVNRGIGRLSAFVKRHNSDDLLFSEAQVYYGYLAFYLQYRQQEAWAYMSSEAFTNDNSFLNLFIRANVALNYRMADESIRLFRIAAQMPQYKQFPIADFELGSALLNKLDMQCSYYFKRFLSAYDGELFVKDTWQRMAIAAYLQGEETTANKYLGNVRNMGTARTDADKQALRFAIAAQWPDMTLLQARLLIDGGYYRAAYEKLSAVRETAYVNITDRLEYYFRLARVLDEMAETDKALQYYQATINMGKMRKEHYASRAALQMAFIYEKRRQTSAAIRMYNECLSMPSHDFKNSIDQQAKAGINRLTD